MLNKEAEQEERYAAYYKRAGPDRNSLRKNRGALFQVLASECSFVRAFCCIELDYDSARVLDVGCGNGSGHYQLIRLGIRPANITGIEVQSERLIQGQSLYPNIHFVHGDATAMDFPDDSFDLVTESTLFATLSNECDCAAIAREMVRVCRPGGYLLLIDWRISRPNDPEYRGLTRRDIDRYFETGQRTRMRGVHRGALVPPLGRFLSSWLPASYFLVAGLFPFLVGQVAVVLQKVSPGTSEGCPRCGSGSGMI